jgi:DNA (cytosine-5)-methyltransferase 1
LTGHVNPPILPNHETATTDQAIRFPICCCQGFRSHPSSGSAMGQGGQSARCSALAVTGWQGEKTVIRYGSVCSGIEAATVAWHGLGWEAAWYSEIESFPSAVLAHHYPTISNYGDMTKFEEWPDEPINLLVGGTPCQSFSVAGLRKGLADPRGNLMLTYGAIARRYRPKWLVWENVPGVLSSNRGRDFGTFLGMLAELGYGFAYRVLDAQYFGVAQRRRRVFVVGHLGSWQRAAAVLFERHSLQGHLAPSRKKGKKVAGTFADDFGNSCKNTDQMKAPVPTTAHCLTAAQRFDPTVETLITSDVAETLIATDHKGPGHNRDHNFIPQAISFPWQSALDPIGQPSDISGTLIKNQTMAVAQPAAQSIGFYSNLGYQGGGFEIGVSPTTKVGSVTAVATAMQVRRLTPVECERLQGFPDNYTNIPWRKKDGAPDGPRYKALGNSMAVPVMRWISERIQQVEEL